MHVVLFFCLLLVTVLVVCLRRTAVSMYYPLPRCLTDGFNVSVSPPFSPPPPPSLPSSPYSTPSKKREKARPTPLPLPPLPTPPLRTRAPFKRISVGNLSEDSLTLVFQKAVCMCLVCLKKRRKKSKNIYTFKYNYDFYQHLKEKRFFSLKDVLHTKSFFFRETTQCGGKMTV